MNPTLELALTKYGEFSPLTAALCVVLILLAALGVWALIQGEGKESSSIQGWGFAAFLLSITAFGGAVIVELGGNSSAKIVKEVLSSPSWEITDPTVEGSTLTALTLKTTPTQPLEFQVLGQTVVAQPERTGIRVSGPLLRILLQNPQMAEAIKGQTTIAKAS
jgi:hypothetical protein